MIFIEAYTLILQELVKRGLFNELKSASMRGAADGTALQTRAGGSRVTRDHQSSIEDEEAETAIVDHLVYSEEDPSAAGRLNGLTRLPPDLARSYRALYDAFIRPGSDNELNLQAGLKKPLDQAFKTSDSPDTHIACFEVVAREVIKVSFFLLSV